MSPKKYFHFYINITLKLIKINGFPKHSFVRLSQLHLCYKATSKIVNFAMNLVKRIKSVLAANKILNQISNIHIQNHLVEGSGKNMKS